MSDISTTMFLKIVKGVAKVPQDSLTSEQGLDEVDLLDPNGFALDQYDIKLPGLKSGATWADSPLTDGRTLISGTLGNVTETIRCNLTAGTMIQLAAMLSKLLRFKQDCNDFWDTQGQIEPVYLKHQIIGEPGPRYALLYDIDIDIEEPINSPIEPQRVVTIAIERETYWRGIAPGDNPKHWFYIANDQASLWNSGNAHLLTGSDHRFYQEGVENRAELNSAVSGWLEQNFVDIPAASIPGDAPALLCLSVSPATTSSAPTTLLVGKTSKRTTGNLSRFTGANQLTIHTFNVGDGTNLTDTTFAADTGTPLRIGGAAGNRSVTTFATASMVSRVSFSPSASSPNGFSVSMLRGKYAVFLRARLSAASTSVNIQLSVDHGVGTDRITLSPVTLTDQGAGGTGNTTDWAFLYLGQVTLPSNKPIDISSDGRGILFDAAGGAGLFVLKLQAERTTGAGSLYMSDLLFMPIDEGSIRIASSVVVNTTRSWLYDNTGYFLHGKPDNFADIFTVSGSNNFEADVPEFGGDGITLTPGVVNRLMFLIYVDSTKRSFINDPADFTVRANIVPRWQGLRDA